MTSGSFPVTSALLLGLAVCGVACGTEGSDSTSSSSSSGGAAAFDEAAVRAAAANHAQAGFTRVNQDPVPGSVHMGSTVNVWVNGAGLATYRGINPANPSSAVFPSGTIIVKEQTESSGTKGLTILAKADPGFDTDHNDWWWARTDAQGAVLGGFSGRVQFCLDCHAGVSTSDYVWGVATDNRTP